MDLESKIEVIPIDAGLQTKVEALAKDGWECAPGAQPVAIYHLVRIKKPIPVLGAGGFGTLELDESKVFIIPAAERQQ